MIPMEGVARVAMIPIHHGESHLKGPRSISTSLPATASVSVIVQYSSPMSDGMHVVGSATPPAIFLSDFHNRFWLPLLFVALAVIC